MSLTAPDSSEGARDGLTFRSPSVSDLGDLLMAAVLLPLAAVVRTGLCALLLGIAALPVLGDPGHWTDGEERALLWLGAALAGVVLIIVVRMKGYVSLPLEPTALRAGRVWPRRIPYAAILYVGLPTWADTRLRPLRGVRRGEPRRDEPKTVPLTFAKGWFQQERIFLTAADAERLLRELYARCPNAAVMDENGTLLPPRNPVRPYHELLLARTFAWRGG